MVLNGRERVLDRDKVIIGDFCLRFDFDPDFLVPSADRMSADEVLSFFEKVEADERRERGELPSRHSIRRILDRFFLTSDELDMFLIDHFADVKKHMAPSMTRTQKINMLLETSTTSDIINLLKKYYPNARQIVSSLVEYTK